MLAAGPRRLRLSPSTDVFARCERRDAELDLSDGGERLESCGGVVEEDAELVLSDGGERLESCGGEVEDVGGERLDACEVEADPARVGAWIFFIGRFEVPARLEV